MLKYSLAALLGADIASAWRMTSTRKPTPMEKLLEVDHSLCTRSIERLFNSVDPNTLFDGSDSQWGDPSFLRENAIYWEDVPASNPNWSLESDFENS